jgi:hypothetical protein
MSYPYPQAFRSLHLQQHLAALKSSNAAVDGSSGTTVDGTALQTALASSPTGAVAAAAAAAHASTAASIASGVLFQCDQAERKCKLGRLARSPVSITFYVAPPATTTSAASRSASADEEEEDKDADDEDENEGGDGHREKEQQRQQQQRGLTREEFFALASESPEAIITQVTLGWIG